MSVLILTITFAALCAAVAFGSHTIALLFVVGGVVCSAVSIVAFELVDRV